MIIRMLCRLRIKAADKRHDREYVDRLAGYREPNERQPSDLLLPPRKKWSRFRPRYRRPNQDVHQTSLYHATIKLREHEWCSLVAPEVIFSSARQPNQQSSAIYIWRTSPGSTAACRFPTRVSHPQPNFTLTDRSRQHTRLIVRMRNSSDVQELPELLRALPTEFDQHHTAKFQNSTHRSKPPITPIPSTQLNELTGMGR